MKKITSLMSLIIQCFYICCTLQTVTSQADSLSKDEIIRNNIFYPPLNTNADLKPLVFGLIMSFGGYLDSSDAVPGVRVALDRINNDTNILPGYSLHYALADSQVCHQLEFSGLI